MNSPRSSPARHALSMSRLAQRVKHLEKRLEDQIVASRKVLALAGKDVDTTDPESIARATRAFNVLEEATNASARELFR
jgi:hypothetical protein